ncbi:phosphoribosylformylglycinamidine cyclo-ligase, partial [Salmonella enterica subsp. enterica serovar Enteritidis]|nr:phosphoribosylformylglycinamidine cyclo-ligase [Salmonella enterica subsp. enterica serovar Enteritidis]
GLAASIELGSWPVPPIFDVIEKAGDVDHMEMYNIFNMGLGMVVAIRPDRVDEAMNLLEHAGEKAYRVGHVIEQVNERV